eukprot:306170-Chlamydomonas_euryale.AAC.2
MHAAHTSRCDATSASLILANSACASSRAFATPAAPSERACCTSRSACICGKGPVRQRRRQYCSGV